MVKAAQGCDMFSEPVILIRVLRDGISGEVRDAGHAGDINCWGDRSPLPSHFIADTGTWHSH